MKPFATGSSRAERVWRSIPRQRGSYVVIRLPRVVPLLGSAIEQDGCVLRNRVYSCRRPGILGRPEAFYRQLSLCCICGHAHAVHAVLLLWCPADVYVPLAGCGKKEETWLRKGCKAQSS